MANPKEIATFSLVTGKLVKVPSVKKDVDGKEKASNYYQFETVSKAGDKNGYGSFHKDIANALKITDKLETGCLVTVTITVYEKPQEVTVKTDATNTF